MSLNKVGFLAHFGDISYHVGNSSNLKIEPHIISPIHSRVLLSQTQQLKLNYNMINCHYPEKNNSYAIFWCYRIHHMSLHL